MVILGIVSGILIGLGISLFLHNRVNYNFRQIASLLEIMETHQKQLEAIVKVVNLDSDTIEILIRTNKTNGKSITAILTLLELMGNRIGFPIPGSGTTKGVRRDTGHDQN